MKVARKETVTHSSVTFLLEIHSKESTIVDLRSAFYNENPK